MALTKYYEIQCDVCEWTDHFIGDAADIPRQAEACGWITAGETHYCSAICRNKDRAGEGVPA